MKRTFFLLFITVSSFCFSQNNFLNGQNPSTFKYINLESFDSDYIQYIYQTEGLDGINYYGSRLLDENHNGSIDIVMRAKEYLEGEWDIPSTPPRRFIHLNILDDFTSKLQTPNEYVFDGDKFLYHSDESGDYYLNFVWGDPVKINQIGVDNYQEYLSNIGYELLRDYVVDSNNEFIEFSPRTYNIKNGAITDSSNTSLIFDEKITGSTAKFPWDQMISPGDFDGDGDRDFLMYAWPEVFNHPNLVSVSNSNSRGYFYFFENLGDGRINVRLLDLDGFEGRIWAIQEGTYSVSIDIDSDGLDESLNEITWTTDLSITQLGTVYSENRKFGYFKIDKPNSKISFTELLDSEDYLDSSPNWNIGPRFMKIIEFDEFDDKFLLLFNTSQAGTPPNRIDGGVTSFTEGNIQQSLKVFKIDSINSRLIDFTPSVFSNGEDKTLSLDNSGRPYLIDVDFDGDQDLFLQIGQTPNSYTGGKAQFESYPSWSGKINTLFYFENTGSGFQLKDLAEIKKLYPSNFNYLEDYTIFNDNGFYTSEDGRQYGIENFIYYNTFSLNDIDKDNQWELITSTNPDYISVFKRKEEGTQNPYENINVIGQSIHRVNEEVINYNFLENNYFLNKNKIYKKIDPNYELKLVLKDSGSKIIREPYSSQKYLTQNKSGEKQFYFAWPNYQQTEEVNSDEDIKYSRFPHFGDQEFSLGSKYDVDLNIPTEEGVLITNHSFDLSEDNLPPLPFNLIDVDTIQSENTSFEIKFHSSTDINQNYHQGNENYSVIFRGNTLSNSQIPGPKYYYELYVNGELNQKVDDVSYTISQDDQGYHIVESFQIETGLATTEGVTFKVFAIDTDDQNIITEMSTVNIDSDQDGVIDSIDNCPSNYNPGQEDSNNNGIGDSCEKTPFIIDPITIFTNEKFKIHLIENPFSEIDPETFRMINGFVEFGTPFTQDVIPIDFNNDGKKDIINGTMLTKNEDGELVDLGHVTLPIYMENLGGFRFSVYRNPNYKDYSLLHAIDDFEIFDVNGDGKDELLLGGEHLHIMNTGEDQFAISNDWLKQNAKYEITQMVWGDYQTEFKYNRYYSFNEDGLLIDEVTKFGNGGKFDFDRNRLLSNGSQGAWDINNDGLIDVLYNGQSENGYVFDQYINEGHGNFKFKRVIRDIFSPNGKLIPVDFDNDGFFGFMTAAVMNQDWKLLMFVNTGGVIDFDNPRLVEELRSNNQNYPGARQATLRNYVIKDLNNDGVFEVIIYLTNQYSGLGSLDFNEEALKELIPHKEIRIYSLGDSIVNTTEEFFNLDGYKESFENWFTNHSNVVFADIDNDGNLDIIPYQTRHDPRNKWDNSEDFQSFSFDPDTGKFQHRVSKGFRSHIAESNLVNTDIYIQNDSYQFDYVDLNGDGAFELVDSSVKYQDKNYMMVIEGSIIDIDTDKDGIGNNLDTDDDGDEVPDTEDAFPLDATESVDTDQDGIGNNADTDDDGDDWSDADEAAEGTDPLDAQSVPTDTDGDGIGNVTDTDDDGDGVLDTEDAFPLDSTESVDTDNDGIGNNADDDDDGDQVSDTEDAFPLDPTESIDTDADGVGNNADTDDDGDGVLDTEDLFPLDSTEAYDADGDGIGDNADDDDDNDQVKDIYDECANTPDGVVVNTSGCEVFALPASTFSVSVTSATCPDSSNGSITISSSNTDYSYRYAIDDQAPQALTDNTQSISNLSAGIYTVCVTVDGVADYQRCYTIEITEPAPLVASSRIDVSTRNLQLDLSGSEEYQVTLNGKTFLTSEDKLSLNLQSGMNRVEVATALDCQGVYFEEIFVSEEVKVYPNPTSGPLQLFVAGSDKEVTLSITSLSGSIIKKETLSVPTNRIIETTLGNVPEGLYLITLNGTTVKTTHKVIKE